MLHIDMPQTTTAFGKAFEMISGSGVGASVGNLLPCLSNLIFFLRLFFLLFSA